jgi:hypothetical protein
VCSSDLICIRYLKPNKEYACYKNLRDINEAKWAAASAEHYVTRTVIPTALLTSYMKVRALPECPSGGKYSINTVGEFPTCSLHENVFNKYGSSEDACINNLRIIDLGKEECARVYRGTNTVSGKK